MDKRAYDAARYQRIKDKKNRQSAAWRAANPEAASRIARHAKWKANYGLDKVQAATLIVNQGGMCAICRCEFMTYDNLHVDHCHDTGHVRGMLCKNCNPGLGQFKDDISRLEAAIAYLQKGGVSS